MQEIITALLVVAAGAWAITQAVGLILPSQWRPIVALVLGAVGSIIVHEAGFITLDQAEPPWSWLSIALFGLIATATAQAGHDLLGFKNVNNGKKG